MISKKIKNPKVSVVIRSYNESKWIKECLDQLYNQSIKPNEILLIDNCSTDGTVQICKKYKQVKIFNYKKKYFPGKMLNFGISKTKNSLILILSAHCIPYDKYFIQKLVEPLIKNTNIFAVYSRQIPLELSDPLTTRDLMITYGPESKLQKIDPQFNNASSLILKDVWNKNKFDEKVTNLEDRIWASKILKKKKYIYYAADSIVYHYHGSHHNNSKSRLLKTNQIIKKNRKIFSQLSGRLKFTNKSILPVFLLRESTENKILEICKKLKKNNFEKFIFIILEKSKIKIKNVKLIKRQKKEHENQSIYLNEVIKFYTKDIIRFIKNEQYILLCTDTYNNYSDHVFNKMIKQLNSNFPDVLFFAKETYEPLFIKEGINIKKINYFLKKDRLKNNPIYIADRTKGIVFHVSNLYKDSIFDGEISIYI